MNQLFLEWRKRYFSNPQVLILWFLLILGFALIFFLGQMLAPVLAAVVIAYLLEGLVNLLAKRKVPRMAAVLIVFIFFMVSLAVLLIILLPLISRQLGQLLQQLPEMFAKGQSLLIQLPERYPDYITAEQIQQITTSLSSQITEFARRLLSYSMASVRGLITVVIYLVLVPLMIFFFLKDKILIMDWVKGFLPDNRGLAREVWTEVNQQFANYVRGKMMEILIIGGVTYIVFATMGLDFAILLALLTGLSVLVPYIGVTVIFFPVALIAFFQWGATVDTLWVMIAYGIIQIFDGNLLAPLLLSRVVNLHPVAIIVAVLVFGGFWGIVGLLFAIPLATLCQAVIKVWLANLQETRKPAADAPG
ncbi:MAG: AI-2E family transporter [Desulfobacterales bacterium]|nr:AI-2E family transporter [Desulfobacterales bacterium]